MTTRVPVSRPGWTPTGATNCSHDSGAQVWLRMHLDRWAYWLPSEGTDLLVANLRGEVRNYATRDDAMAAAEDALVMSGLVARALEHHLRFAHPSARVVGRPVQQVDGTWEARVVCDGNVVVSEQAMRCEVVLDPPPSDMDAAAEAARAPGGSDA